MNKSRKHFIAWALLLMIQGLIAQNDVTIKGNLYGGHENDMIDYSKHAILDKGKVKCVYEYVVLDSVLDRVGIYTDILIAGNNISKYNDYMVTYRRDSMVYCREGQKTTLKEYMEVGFGYRDSEHYRSTYTLFKDFGKGEIFYKDGMAAGDNYVYTEPTSNLFDWKMVEGLEDVCGYTCNKAEVDFRGRKWTAYYAMDIPVSDGPWKFCGLPGLILRIEDSSGQHRFLAISVRQTDEDIYEKGHDKKGMKIDRKKFNAKLLEYKNEGLAFMAGSPLMPKDAQGNEMQVKKKKMFYNPIELD